MGACERRRLRAAVELLFYSMLLALTWTILTKYLFTSTSRHLSMTISSSSNQPITLTTIPTPKTMVVIASTSRDDTSWLSSIPPSLNYTLAHSITDAPLSPALSVPQPAVGNEAMVYLTYIIDHYATIQPADIIVFHHAHRKSWHQRLDALDELARLRPEYVLRTGYTSLRCPRSTSHTKPACENVVQLKGGKLARDFGAAFVRADRKTQLVTMLAAFEDGEVLPERIAAPCCAQFAVSGEAVLRREREWWVELREWLRNTPLKSINSGRLMEQLWHVWFGMEAELCAA